MEPQPRFVLGAVARSSWKTDRFLTIWPSAISGAQSCAHETMAHAKTISTCYPFLGFAFFPKPARIANGAVCENPEIQKTCLLEKTPPGAHINKTYAAARARLRRRGTAAAFLLTFRKKCFAFFAAKPQSSKINAFQFVRRIGNVLAAFCGRAGCALAALWGRSAAHTRPSQRPELAFRPGPLALRLPRSLPTGCRCGDLAPSRAAGPASKQVNYKSLPSAPTSLGFQVPTCRRLRLGALFSLKH